MEAIRYVEGEIPKPDQIEELYQSVAPGTQGSADDRYRAVKQSQWVATAWHGDRLVGLVRVITDRVFVAYLQELSVHADYHHQGVGKELLDCYANDLVPVVTPALKTVEQSVAKIFWESAFRRTVFDSEQHQSGACQQQHAERRRPVERERAALEHHGPILEQQAEELLHGRLVSRSWGL